MCVCACVNLKNEYKCMYACIYIYMYACMYVNIDKYISK